MKISRRGVIKGVASIPMAAYAAGVEDAATTGVSVTLPDKRNFPFDGVFLNAAFTHPLGKFARRAADDFLDSRSVNVTNPWPRNNPRDSAVAQFAGLINADPADVAIVPSTMSGENAIAQALRLGPGAGVVTDAFHYHASLALYGELKSQGMPLSVAEPRDGLINMEDLEACMGGDTRLVAISMISSETGFEHDLKAVSDLAHANGACAYVDAIQAAGAVPIDVKASGVDFLCSGTYKWLMGDFGIAFLYVRPDRHTNLARTQVGWRQIEEHQSHAFPFDPPGPVEGSWTLGTGAGQFFEVGSPSYVSLAMSIAAIRYIQGIGIDHIVNHRQPMLERLQLELPRYGFGRLTPLSSRGPIASFSFDGAAKRFATKLAEQQIAIKVSDNRIRISPSVYTDMSDIDRLLRVLSR